MSTDDDKRLQDQLNVANNVEAVEPVRFPLVQGLCPRCDGNSLFLGDGGYVTCSRLDCTNPSSASELLGVRFPEATPPSPAEDALAVRLRAQREWSLATFGPGQRLAGILAHIRKELREVEEQPLDAEEWIDVAILAFDGAWRAGWEPEQIVAALDKKYRRNRERTWPDWRTAPEGEPIEHVREVSPADDTPPDTRSEVETLRHWKAEAMTVLAEWDQVFDALGGGRLGESKAAASLDQVQRLTARHDSDIAAAKAAERERIALAIETGPWGRGMPNGMHKEAIRACARIVRATTNENEELK